MYTICYQHKKEKSRLSQTCIDPTWFLSTFTNGRLTCVNGFFRKRFLQCSLNLGGLEYIELSVSFKILSEQKSLENDKMTIRFLVNS